MRFSIDDWQVLDLSLPLDENNPFEPFGVKITRFGHRNGIANLNKVLKNNKRKMFKPGDFPHGEFLSNEIVSASVHAGTHLDAPFHFGTNSEGKRAKFICEVPLNCLIGRGVVLDVSFVAAGENIQIEDIRRACKKIRYSLTKNDIILLMTGVSRLFGRKEYFYRYPGMSGQATKYLLDAGIKLIGIDTPGLDRPLLRMVDDFALRKDKSVLWPSHFLGRKKEYYHIERLANLEKIPHPKNFIFCGLPVKILNCGAGWTRAVALIKKGGRK